MRRTARDVLHRDLYHPSKKRINDKLPKQQALGDKILFEI